MVLEVISTEGQVIPHFFQQGQKETKEAYKGVLKAVVIPWMNEVTDGKPYKFQQDSAPAHKAKIVQELLEQNVPDCWPPLYWPANSPDLNPCDFYLWGRVERITCIIIMPQLSP
uniref:Tc1-like transposase DDE domain-containing protein n=1 Tax=Lepeophtheirus salmonis TaxID=72036 RepID=A0A0K2U2D3_LEPSM